jgi:hypothetical protein
MRLQMNQSLSTFLLVLSILAIVLAIALFESGHAWLFHSTSPPNRLLWVPGAVAVGYVVLRMILKRL